MNITHKHNEADIAAVQKMGVTQQIAQRILVERAIIRRAATDLIAAGYTLRVSYGEGDYGTERTQDLEAIMAACHACDEEWLLCLKPSAESKTGYQLKGSIYLVYGNDGWDVIADYATSLEEHLGEANKFAETFC